MSTLTRITTWSSGDTLTASALNGEFNNIINDYNGSISNANIASNAAISASKLDSSLLTASSTSTLTNKTLTSPKVGTAINDTNGNELMKVVATSSAVNEVTLTNAAAGSAPIIEATGDDTNIHLVARAKGNGLTKISVLRQDDASSTYKHNTVILSGWGYVTPGAATNFSDSVSFNVTFADRPIVVVGYLGSLNGSNPTHIGSFNEADSTVKSAVIGALNTSTTGFTLVGVMNGGATAIAAYRYGYSWTAIGELA
jgi:hypothetical protein